MSKDVTECVRVCAWVGVCLHTRSIFALGMFVCSSRVVLSSSCITADWVSRAKDCVINTGKRLNGFLAYPNRGHPGWAVLTRRHGLRVLIPGVSVHQGYKTANTL